MAGSFSFDTPDQVLMALSAIRTSDISATEKSALRDLILSYTNGGKDPSLKIQIEQQLAQLQITPMAQPVSMNVVTPPAFGSSRMAPQFTPPTPASAPAPAPEPATTPTQTTPATPSVTPRPPQPATPDTAPASNASPVAATPANSAVAPASAAATPQTLSDSVGSAPPPPEPPSAPVAAPTPAAPSNLPTEPAAPEPTPAPSGVAGPDANLQRIREIKALVNEKVGNPVNLVDIDNEVGREYMAALLNAMKTLNDGTGSAAAMSRLESAFTTVQSVLKAHDETAAKADQADETTQAPEPASTAVSGPAPTPSSTTATTTVTSPTTTDRAPEPPATEAPVQPNPVPTQNAELLTPHSSETEDEPETVPSSGSTKAEPSRPILVVGEDPSSARRWANNEIRVAPAVAPLHDPAEDRAPNTSVAAKPEDTKSQPTGEPTPLEPVIPTAPAASETSANPVKIKTAPNKAIPDIDVSSQTSSKGVGVKPLSKSGEPLKSVDDLPTADSLKTASKSGDPLYTKEVDDGLNQLLTDWTLFKKSGLFGTGKKGYEHPLFQKIKDLQIPVLLAGRFPGATQEIKQSITDYMNGWRYEQGVIYEQGETFEHYLRRVIRHILDLQK